MLMKTKYITAARNTTSKQKHSNAQQELTTAIILSDIEIHRMKSYGPLPLIDVAGTRLIDTQIASIRKLFKNLEVIVCVSNCADKVHKHIKQTYKDISVRIVENQNHNLSNSIESVRICLNNTTNDKILIMSGDLLLWDSILYIDTKNTCILTESKPSDNLDIGVNVDEKNIAQHFSFGANKVWSEVLFLQNEASVDSFRKNLLNNYNKNKFMFEVLNDFATTKSGILCISNQSKIEKINNIKEYHKIKDRL